MVVSSNERIRSEICSFTHRDLPSASLASGNYIEMSFDESYIEIDFGGGGT
jgi:hypothetical protein